MVEQVFGGSQRVGAALGETLGERVGGGGEVGERGHDLVDDAALKGLLTRHQATHQQHAAGTARADFSHEGRRNDGGADAQVNFREAQLAVGVGQGDVGDAGEAAAAADRRAVDAGDGDHGQGTNLEAEVGEGVEERAGGAFVVEDGLQVHARAERAACTGEDADGGIGALGEFVDAGVEVTQQVERECVAGVFTLEREGGDAVGEGEGGEGHGGSSAKVRGCESAKVGDWRVS